MSSTPSTPFGSPMSSKPSLSRRSTVAAMALRARLVARVPDVLRSRLLASGKPPKADGRGPVRK